MHERVFVEKISTIGVLENSVMRRVAWRTLPLLMLCYFISYVDCVNVGFAALQMNKDIGLTPAVFGLGGGLFYIAYIIFEIPSNLAMHKVGARLWIPRIMITWGLVGAASAFAAGPYSFYVSRFLLGAAEAGFFPGVILYLTYWYPKEYRGRVVALFMVAIPVSSLLGSPFSAACLDLDGWLGLRGWQLVFILEAIPAIVLGIAVVLFLPSRPDDARWLDPKERDWLNARVGEGASRPQGRPWHLVGEAFSDRGVLALAFIYAGTSATSNALSLWQPQILKSFGLSTMQTGLLNAVPFGIAAVGMIVWGRYTDRTQERRWSTALPLALTCAGLLGALLTDSLSFIVLLLTLTLLGNYAVKGPFWSLATEVMSSAHAAAGIAIINTLSHVGTSGATWLLGYIKDQTGSFPLALTPLAALTGAGAAITLWVARDASKAGTAGQAVPPSAPR